MKAPLKLGENAHARLAVAFLVLASLIIHASARAALGRQQSNAASSNASSSEAAVTVAGRLGYPRASRLLIIHADDLGMMRSVDRASFEALEKGWITSASVLVVCPWFPEVVHFAQAHPDADLGVHLALTSEWTSLRWGPVSHDGLLPSLVDRDGFLLSDEDAVAARAKTADAEHELRAQIQKARSAGMRITHFDSHMNALLGRQDLFALYLELGRANHLPVRVTHQDTALPAAPAMTPAFQAQVLIDRELQMQPGVPVEKWLEAYKQMLQPAPPGVYVLTVHLGYDDDELRGATLDHPDWGAAWRQADFDLVRSPGFQRFLKEQDFILIGYKDLARALPKDAPKR